MSLLILPRPERVTMPAAILAKPEKRKIPSQKRKDTEAEEVILLAEEKEKTSANTDTCTEPSPLVHHFNPATTENASVDANILGDRAKPMAIPDCLQSTATNHTRTDTPTNVAHLLLQLDTLLQS